VKRRAHFLGSTAFLAIVLISVAPVGNGRVPAQHADAGAQASGPRIAKLEPPSWWVGFTPEIEVLASGENLEGARISSSYPGVSIVRSKVTDGGRYLFAWLHIAEDARAGDALLNVQTGSGSTSVHFPLERRGSAEGKFQGFSQDDVI
jgi:neopullulanase